MTAAPRCATAAPACALLAWLGAISVIALSLAGCAASPQERFHTLRPGAVMPAPTPAVGAAPADASAASKREATTWQVAVGPVVLPALLDRPQWVVRRSGTEVQILQQQRWAQALDADIAEALAVQLSRAADAANNRALQAYPDLAEGQAATVQPPTVRIRIQVLRLDSVLADASPEIDDEIRWEIRCTAKPERPEKSVNSTLPANGLPKARTGLFAVHRAVAAAATAPGADRPLSVYDRLALAHAGALAELGRELAVQAGELAPLCPRV